MASANKTSRLKLNVWAAGDSPMRTDFNSDNELIDAAVQSLESGLAANASDHAAMRSEMSSLVDGASDELYAYARETRRLVLDAYAMALSADTSAIMPGTSDVWVEDFTDLDDIDLTAPDTTARGLKSNEIDPSTNYIFASAGHHPSLGDTYLRGSKSNIALPFTVPENCRITGLFARPVYSPGYSGSLNVTCTVYRATASGGTYTLGEQVFTATKERSTVIPNGESYNDAYANYVDTPFTLAAGIYCAVFYGDDIRANGYHTNYDGDGNPKLAPYDKLYTLPGGSPSAALTVTENYYADAAVFWAPLNSPYGWLNTKMLGFDRAMKSAAVYVYCDTDDLQCACSVLDSNGAGSALTVDADMRNAPVPGGLYVTKLSGSLAGALTDAKLRLGLHSPTFGRIKRLLLFAMRTGI